MNRPLIALGFAACLVPVVSLACGGSNPPAASPSASGSAPAASATGSADSSASSAATAEPPGSAVIIPRATATATSTAAASASSSGDSSDPGSISIRYDVVVGLGGLESEVQIPNVGIALKPLIFAARGCYQKALERDGRAGGKLTLALKVGKNGDVVGASASDSMLDAAATNCVVALGKNQKFEPDAARPAQVKVSFTLSFKRQR